MFLGGFALIDWGMVENGLSKNSAILACAVILILMLAIEKLLCGKRLTQRGEWPGFKLGGTMVLTAWLFIGVSSAIDLQDSFSADLQYHFNTFLIASALCVHMLISAIEMFVKKKRGRGCAAAAMFAGLVYYLVWFVS